MDVRRCALGLHSSVHMWIAQCSLVWTHIMLDAMYESEHLELNSNKVLYNVARVRKMAV